MLTRRRFLSTGLALGGGLWLENPSCFAAAASEVDAAADSSITGRNSLKAHAEARGLLAGAAVSTQLLASDPVYARVLAEQYSILVAENAMKWKALRPAADKFDFTAGDALVTFAREHGIRVRGHNLVWHEALPDWFSTTVTKENAKYYLVDHITTVADHYRGKLHSWDVVNEAVLPKDGRPDGLRKSPWMELLGPDYIEIAFRAARHADPHALLTYNEYGVEYNNEEDSERRATTLRLLRRLKGSGVPLDAVGIQSHIKAGSAASIGIGLRDYMRAARDMGLKIFITELDVNEDDLSDNNVASRDRIIAQTYSDYLNLVLAEPAVTAVLTWGVSDNHTWLNNGPTHHKKQPDRPQRSLPFDSAYLPKEAFFAIRSSFDQRRRL
jgi:endo-1,4-beta-xylanase